MNIYLVKTAVISNKLLEKLILGHTAQHKKEEAERNKAHKALEELIAKSKTAEDKTAISTKTVSALIDKVVVAGTKVPMAKQFQAGRIAQKQVARDVAKHLWETGNRRGARLVSVRPLPLKTNLKPRNG